MEFVEAVKELEIVNKICLIRLDDDDINVPHKSKDKTKPTNTIDRTSQTDHEADIVTDSNNTITITKSHQSVIDNWICFSDSDDDIEAPGFPKNETVFNNTPDVNIIQDDVTIERQKEYNLNDSGTKTDKQASTLPPNFIVGQAISDGNCFFDSFRQGLKQLGIDVITDNLRYNCKKFAEEHPPEWFVTAIRNSHHNYGVRRETVHQYIQIIHSCDRWGDPDVEGRILCGFYDVSLYIIEKHQALNEQIYTSQLITKMGCKSANNIDFNKKNTIFMINHGHGHFNPIVKIQTSNFSTNNWRETINHNEEIKIHENSDQSISCSERREIVEIFNKLENAIKEGNLELLNSLIHLLYQIPDKLLLEDIYNDNSNSIRGTHLITIACKYNQLNILDFLLNKSIILYYLPKQGPIVDKAHVQALCYAMQSLDIHMLETLFDYWSGNVHWVACGKMSNANYDVVTNLKRLNNLLVEAGRNSMKFLGLFQQMLVDVHCLISFNIFQIKLFTKLNKLVRKREQSPQISDSDIRKNEVEGTIAILTTAFDVYEKYSNKNIRLSKRSEEDEVKLELLLQDDSIYMKFLLYFMYDTYYRKLDYSIALLIINNLHSLKLRINMKNDAYQEIEATLYYFLYRVNQDWKPYLPEDRVKFKKTVLTTDNDGLVQLVKLLYYDPHRLYNGPVIYLEWQKFKNSLNEFKLKLKNIDTVKNLRQLGEKLPQEEINNLSLLPYMRDDYSLKKILQYLEQVSYIHDKDTKQDKISTFLIIQRIIQITGEFFKSTEKSCHLSPTTLALLQIEIPRSTYKFILDLRDSFSHARDGKLIRRIDLENIKHPVFYQILDDLKEIKKAINKVICIYKPVLEKSLLRLGLSLINERYEELPKQAIFLKPVIECHSEAFNYGYEIYIEIENSFINKEWNALGFTRQLYREIASLAHNSNNLMQQWNQRDKDSIKILKNNIKIYTKFIEQTVNMIREQNKIWESIKKDLKQIQSPSTLSVLDHPNTSCIKYIRTALKDVKKEVKAEILRRTGIVKDWAVEWVQIKQLINFIVLIVGIFKEHHWEIKHSSYTRQCNDINNSDPDNTGIDNVILLINSISSYIKNPNIIQIKDKPYEYSGLQTLGTIMQTKFFITTREMKYLKNNTHDICDCDTNKVCYNHKILMKLYNNTVINEKEYETIKNLNISDKCKKIIKNLVNGNKRDSNMLECLINRMNLLNVVLQNERDIRNLTLRYRQEVNFSIMIEMIVSDIMNIFAESWLKEFVNSSDTKLLAEYPLRNILAHGNPLLEISSKTLDANDFPSALIKFALDVVEDKSYLDDLFELYEEGVNRADITSESSDNLSPKHIKLVSHFKSCTKWKSYVKILPTKNST